MTTRYNIQLNLMLSSELSAALDWLVQHEQKPKAAIMREALVARYRMIALRTPTCASGAACPVPHIHAQGAVPLTPPSLPQAAQQLTNGVPAVQLAPNPTLPHES